MQALDLSKYSEEELKSLPPEELLSIGEKLLEEERERSLNPIKFYKPNRAQEKFHYCTKYGSHIPRLRMFEAGNKVGKSAAAIIEGISFAIGYRPWLPEDHPLHKTPLPVPNTGRIIAEDFPTGVQQNIFSLLKEWRPVGMMPHGDKWFKKNQAGYISQVHFNNGSIIHLMSYDQDTGKFEGVDWDWCVYNEPPPREIYIANERGKVARSGYSWMAYTPLKEPWIFDEIVSTADEDEDIECFRGCIWDNWIGNGGILSLDAIRDFEKKLTPEEREARIYGRWRHLEGLIFKEFDGLYDEATGTKIEHIIEDFVPPRNVTWVEGIDPHDKKPTCVLFCFVDDEDNIYAARQLILEGMTVPAMADKIRATRAELRYHRPLWTVMDAKAGGWDLTSSRNMAPVESFEKQFRDNGIYTMPSDSRPGAVDSGIKIIRQYLQPEYNVRLGVPEPKLRVFKSLCQAQETNRGKYGFVYQMKRWQWDEKGQPEKKNDDFPAILRYVLTRKPRHKRPGAEPVKLAYRQPAASAAGY